MWKLTLRTRAVAVLPLEEKGKKKNLPLAARVKAAKNRRTSFVSKRVKDKQFKGRFRK